MRFSRAITKIPCARISEGLSESGLGKPDFKMALQQHENYIEVLKDCGLEVINLNPDPEFPDSTFVEDTALLIPDCAIVCNPGAPSRKGETEKIKEVLSGFFSNIEFISPPGTIEAGDIMMVGTHFYIGLSGRTNPVGASQIIEILKKYGLSGSTIKIDGLLHLKTGISYLENNNLLIQQHLLSLPAFEDFNKIIVPEDELYAANSVWINDKVLVPGGYPKTKSLIEKAEYKVLTVDVSEFRKLDGGLSCLSLRF
jgi:dimethylargininase